MDIQLSLFEITLVLSTILLPSAESQTAPEHQYKKVIMFLTPSQIRAYEDSQRIKPVVEPNQEQDTKAYNNYQHVEMNTDSPHKYSKYPSHHELVLNTVTNRNNNQASEPVQFIIEPGTFQKHNKPYFNPSFSYQNPTSTGQYAGPVGQQSKDSKNVNYIQKYQLIPYEFDTQDSILREGPAILNSAFEIIIAPQVEPTRRHPTDYYHIDNYFPFDFEARAKDIQKERELAQKTAEAIAKSPLILLKNEINITRKIPLDGHGPVPPPYVIPITQKYPVPQTYAVPVQVMRPFAVPFIRSEKVEVDKPVQVEVEKQVHSPVEKNVSVKINRPYKVEKIIPVEVKKKISSDAPVYDLPRYSIIRH